MVTTVGTSSDLKSLIENFILLEHDAIAAYDATIERLEDASRRDMMVRFRDDHQRHLSELTTIAGRIGADVPAEGDAKEMLTTGKVQLADMVGGDGAVLRAMATNESDTVSAYESGAGNDAIPAEDREVFIRGLEDERRHKKWMESEAQAA